MPGPPCMLGAFQCSKLTFLCQLSQSLSGVRVNDAIIISVETGTHPVDVGQIALLITIFSSNEEVGSDELTEAVYSRLNTTARELNIVVTVPLVRYGELAYFC